jgi:hypothetical protein
LEQCDGELHEQVLVISANAGDADGYEALRRKLDRIADQVDEDLPNPIAITPRGDADGRVDVDLQSQSVLHAS